MIREYLKNEISNLKPAKISREVLENLYREIQHVLDWCLSNLMLEVCSHYIELLDDLASKLAKVRLAKSVDFTIPEDSIDKEVINLSLGIVERYFKLTLKGFVDSEGYVAVVVKSSDLVVDGKHFSKGALTTLKIHKALLLEKLGYIDIVS